MSEKYSFWKQFCQEYIKNLILRLKLNYILLIFKGISVNECKHNINEITEVIFYVLITSIGISCKNITFNFYW